MASLRPARYESDVIRDPTQGQSRSPPAPGAAFFSPGPESRYLNTRTRGVRGGFARLRLDRFELGALAAFSALSLWVLALALWQVVAHGRLWTGTDGVYLVDQLQYLAWVRDASHHVLVSNLFVLRDTPHDFFQPAIAISGGLTAAGVPAWLSLLLWKPVAVGAAFFAIRAYIRRMLPGQGEARAALVLALFFTSFTVLYGSAGTVGDLFLGFVSWGYVFALLSLACLLAALLAHDRLRSAERIGWVPGALGLVASLLHPWHGELLIVIVVVAEAMTLDRRSWRRRLGLTALTAGLTAAPLIYYELLGRLDLSWQLARVASKHSFPLGSILLALAPLLVPALIACARRPRSFLAATAPAWLISALIIYAVSASGVAATPLHAFEGISIPLAVLAVQGFERLGWSRLRHHGRATAALIAAVTLPALVYDLLNARNLVAFQPAKASFIRPDEQKALRYLARDPTSGGVMARSYLGALVPGETGRRTFVGDCLWSEPDCSQRLVTVRDLFTGGLTPAVARAKVLDSGARFLLADCRRGIDLRRELGPVITGEHRFGCARVYQVQ